MTAFMLACYLSGSLSATLHFRNVNDCLYYSRYLGDQTYDSADGKQIIYECMCKVVPNVDTKKVRVY
jgi:hypothetical protein